MKFLREIKTAAVLLSLTTTPLTSFGAEKNYQVVPNADGTSGIQFSIGYSLGTHEGTATEITGSLSLQDSPFLISTAAFTVPLNKVNTGNAKRDCHLLEAMGLDYSVSDYPNQHICNGNNELPLSGKNAVAFNEIKFTLTTLLSGPGKATAIGVWEMHGVKKQIEIPLTLTVVEGSPAKLKVKTDFDLSLNDFGIIVKKVLFVTVKDTAHVSMELTLQEK